MNSIFANDDMYDSNNRDDYHLSVMFDHTQCSIVVLDTVWNRYVVQKKFALLNSSEQSVEELICMEPLLTKKYQSINILFCGRHSVLVPKRYFDADRARQYLALNCDLPNDTSIQINYIPKIKAYNIFGITNDWKNIFARRFPDAKIFHQATLLLTDFLCLPAQKSTKNTSVAVNFHSRFIDVAVRQNEKLLLYNTFETSCLNDCFYYIMFVIQQLKQKADNIKLYGQIETASVLIKQLRKVIGTILYASRPAYFDYSTKLDVFTENHQYVNLYNLYKCE